LQSAKAKACVLACYNGMVPYLCTDLPESQKEALHYGVKEPFIYTHVAIRNWTAFHKLGIRQIISPGGYHCFTMVDFPVSLGEYKFFEESEAARCEFWATPQGAAARESAVRGRARGGRCRRAAAGSGR